ncbi:MAG: M20/M25/M40 family metallo-hydrolase, partial [Kiritimatiellae bacterium]|nr:M20/M25/M40 family metallo-hydrolase [Kiritimatiellia bacterium]
MEESVQSEYFELLRFKSVGADPECFRDCVDCASWLRRWLGRLGFEGEMLYPEASAAEGGRMPPPVLFAERKGDEGSPVLLFYGHYDVQPADPAAEWKTPPFEPTVVDGRVYCRGAQDDKGQFFAFLCGIRDYLAGEGPKPTIKIVLEGQEESGSDALGRMAPSMRR